jgi:predicted amino acid-binding ACT domain protein
MTMKLKVSRGELWSAVIDDRPGGVAAVLEPMAKAGANFEFAFARRTPENPGKGTLFVLPVKGAKLVKAAQEAGLTKAESIHTVKLEGSDKPGIGAAIASALGSAGISFRGISATVVGKEFAGYVALDSAEDAAKAATVLKKL